MRIARRKLVGRDVATAHQKRCIETNVRRRGPSRPAWPEPTYQRTISSRTAVRELPQARRFRTGQQTMQWTWRLLSSINRGRRQWQQRSSPVHQAQGTQQPSWRCGICEKMRGDSRPPGSGGQAMCSLAISSAARRYRAVASPTRRVRAIIARSRHASTVDARRRNPPARQFPPLAADSAARLAWPPVIGRSLGRVPASGQVRLQYAP